MTTRPGHSSRLLTAIALIALLAAAAPGSAAVLTWQNSGTGDWFDGTNWDGGGAVPGPGDTASIANGGMAQAAGATVKADTLLLAADPLLGTMQSGSLEALGVPVDVAGMAAVGIALPGMASAKGRLTVTGPGLTVGGLEVGNTGNGAAGSSAAGVVDVAGAISGATGNLVVGQNAAVGGTAEGAVSGQSYSGEHAFVAIGRDFRGGAGTGALVVDDALSLGRWRV